MDRRTLAALAPHPDVRAADVAAHVGLDTQSFKLNVRKLKALGLTISPETGYRLSQRGERILHLLRHRAGATSRRDGT
jgi:Mn-dependent DtxR family transcriptional regulator